MSDLIDLNENCLCIPVNRDDLDAGIIAGNPIDGLGDLLDDRSSLFAGTAVFVSQANIQSMQAQINAIEAAARLEGYQEQALGRLKTPVLQAQPTTTSVLMGYDFHITDEEPKLIEVNTNAGGAFLVQAMEQALAQTSLSCGDQALATPKDTANKITDMFIQEWQLTGRTDKPKTIAIVDTDPAEQYLYPDMLLAKTMLEQQGLNVFILDPSELDYDGEALTVGSTQIDFVYNRLTDFHLKEPGNLPIRMALLDDNCVISPAPRHHALYADKRNLLALSRPDQLRNWGLDEIHVDALHGIPETILVSEQDPNDLWARRKGYFFKPATGFGSRAAYRGDKLTKRVWEEILRGDYVAQRFVAPTTRGLHLDDIPTSLKFDLRVYTYAGEPLLYAARVYQGQTTNFRTKGGGFAPVIRTG